MLSNDPGALRPGAPRLGALPSNAGPAESCRGADGEPFLWTASGRSGCLLVHGFTATPQEMRFLGERLHANGYTVNGVRVAGHGTCPEDLERCRWPDWYASAREGLVELHRHTPEVVAVGQSMGALLALKLAADYPAIVGGVVLLSPALVLSRRWLRWIAPTLPALLPLLSERRWYVNKPERDVADPRARAESFGYDRIPLRGLVELTRLQRAVQRLLPQVQQPVLVVHSRHDHNCPLVNVDIVKGAVRGQVHAVLLEHSYHVVSVDVEKDRVAAEVAAFVERTIGAAAPAAVG